MREIGFTSKVFSPDSIVGQLSGGERQGVALARAIYNKADLIVMDEPTTALSLTETEKVFRFVRAVRAGGRSVLFIGHNIHHVFDIAERFVVMDRGTVALQATKAEVGYRRAPDRLHGEARASARHRDSALAWPSAGGGRMSASLEPIERAPSRVARPPESALRRFADRNRAALGTFAVFVVMIAIFMAASPSVFLHWPIYNSVLVTLPVALCLVVPLVFVVTVGEIDLSFPATMGFSAWIFALDRACRLEPVPWHRRGARDRHGAGRRRRRAGRDRGALVADRDARHELHAARLHHDRDAGQIDRAARTAGFDRGRAVLGPDLRLSRADLLGAGVCRVRGAAVQSPQVRRAGTRGRRQPRQRQPDGHQRRRECASRPSFSWASAPRSRACSPPWSISPGGRRPATATSCRR